MKKIDLGNGVVVRKKGPYWWPPLWLHKFLDRYVRKRLTLRGSWEIVTNDPAWGWCKEQQIAFEAKEGTPEHLCTRANGNLTNARYQ